MGEEIIKEVNRLNRLVKNAVEYRQHNRDTEYINNEAHYEGLHWKLADMNSDSPFIVKSDINHLKNAVDIRLGSLSASSYYGILKPLSPDDVEKIEDLNILYQNEWRRLNLDDLVEKAVKNGCKFDNGYIELGFNTDKVIGGTNSRKEGVITAEVIDTADIYLDPSAESIDKCNFYIKPMKLTIEELKRDYPDWYSKLKKEGVDGSAAKTNESGNIFTGRDYSNNQDNIVIVYAIYEKVKKKVDYVIREESIDEMTRETIPAVIEKMDVTRVKVSYVHGDILLYVNEDYPFEDFPIIPFQWEEIPQSPYGIPLLRGLTIPQKVANLIESSINNIAVHYTIPTWIISDDSGLDVDDVAKLINALGVVWKVTDINTAIKQLEPPKINSDIIQMGQTFVGYIKEYAGVTSAYNGNIGTAGSTSQGTTDAIGRATIIDNNPLSQISKFVEKITRLLIKFMTRYYQGDNIYVRKDVDNEKYEFKSFEIDDKYQDLDFDFDVDLGSRSKNDKNRQYNLIKDIYQLQNQYKDSKGVINVTDVIKAAQLDNYNEMKNRLDNVKEETLEEKATMIVRLVEIGNTITPNGQPLIDSTKLSDAIMDVLDDNNDLSVVEEVIQTYQQYQEQFSNMKQQLSNNFSQQRQLQAQAMQQGIDNTNQM